MVHGASVFLNDGTGTAAGATWTRFSMPQAPANPVDVVLADLDGDTHADIVTANQFGVPPWGSNLAARPGNGDGTFGAAVAVSVGYTDGLVSHYNPRAVAAVDLNCDGKADLIAGNENTLFASVILTGGSGADTTAPAISGPANITLPAGVSCVLHLTDAQIGTATATDNCGTPTVIRTGVPAGNDFPVGMTTITYTATDGSGNTSTATQTVTVTAPPPAIENVSATPAVLWPPNHRMADVTISYETTGGCSGVSCVIDSIVSNEPANGSGDGDTAPDWEIAGAHHVRLRAERSGGGSGRTYTVRITCTDGEGHTTSSAVTVAVAKNQK